MWVQKIHVCEKDYVWNHAAYNYENGKYLASIVDDLAIMGDEIIDVDDEARAIPTNFNEKKITERYRYKRLHILLFESYYQYRKFPSE